MLGFILFFLNDDDTFSWGCHGCQGLGVQTLSTGNVDGIERLIEGLDPITSTGVPNRKPWNLQGLLTVCSCFLLPFLMCVFQCVLCF